MTVEAPASRIIVALDMPSVAEARGMVGTLGDAIGFYKIGLELLFAGGFEFAEEVARSGRRVFVDAKLLDIGNTVERAVANIARRDVTFLTVHGHDLKTMRAAVRGRGASVLKLLAVTVLTSLDATDLEQQGSALGPADLVLRRARLAKEAGFDGVIASGHEAGPIRAALGGSFLIVTPGIRLPGGDTQDQSRVMTPEAATAAGADYLVVGRPITGSSDPRAAAEAFVERLSGAVGGGRP